MPNHYTHVVTCYPNNDAGEDAYDALPGLLAEWAKSSLERVAPMPEELRETTSPRRDGGGADLREKYGADNWFDWACANWGTKWGTYGVSEVVSLPGDQGPQMVSFQSAWGPPLPAVRKLMMDELQKFATGIKWVGMDPCDTSSVLLEEG